MLTPVPRPWPCLPLCQDLCSSGSWQGRGLSHPSEHPTWRGRRGIRLLGWTLTGESRHQDSCWGPSAVMGRWPTTPDQEAMRPGGRNVALSADRLKL